MCSQLVKNQGYQLAGWTGLWLGWMAHDMYRTNTKVLQGNEKEKRLPASIISSPKKGHASPGAMTT